MQKQECIPDGCVPSAAVALPGGVCLVGGRRVFAQGVSAQGMSARVCVCQQSICLLGGVCLRGVCLPGGVTDTIAPVDKMTDTCKTLPCRNYVGDGNYGECVARYQLSDNPLCSDTLLSLLYPWICFILSTLVFHKLVIRNQHGIDSNHHR